VSKGRTVRGKAVRAVIMNCIVIQIVNESIAFSHVLLGPAPPCPKVNSHTHSFPSLLAFLVPQFSGVLQRGVPFLSLLTQAQPYRTQRSSSTFPYLLSPLLPPYPELALLECKLVTSNHSPCCT
jgi:hypothetical protein